MWQEPSIDTSKRMIVKLTRERRADPLDEDTAQLHSEPAKVRFRWRRRFGWPDDQTQREI